MKTRYKLAYFLLGLTAVVALGAQLQTYPIVTTIGSADLIPFSHNVAVGQWNSPVNITGPNFAVQMAILGGYPGLGLNNVWTGNNLHNGGDTFSGGVTIPNIGAPPNSLLYGNSGFVVQGVTLGSNLTLVAGVLSATSSVTTNDIILPLAQTNGGTGTATPALIPMAIGAAYANGTTQFPGLFDTGPATNAVLVLVANGQGPAITNVTPPGANGRVLGSTNTTPGVAWFPAPLGGITTNFGAISFFGWTNLSGAPEVVDWGMAASDNVTVYDAGGNGWITYSSINGTGFSHVLPPNWAIVSPSGSMRGLFHSLQ